ncbi:MAG: hypothetical protein RIT45_2278, partial [Pseudomonadota bacterium]
MRRRVARWATRVWLGVAWVLLAAPAVAAPPTARVETQVQPLRVTEGDTVTVEIVCSGDYDELLPPTSDGFDLSQTGRSSQVSILGSRVQRSERFTYVGTPRRKGRHRILGARLRRDGREVARGQDVFVEVVDARASLGPALPPDQAAAPSRYLGEPFFVRPLINVMRPYVGQPFVLGYDLYWSRNQNVTGLREIGEPDYGNFTFEDLLADKQSQQQPVRFGGGAYMSQTTRKVLLVATRPGKHEILGPRYRVDVSNFFDTRAYKVGPPPIEVEVQPLPTEGKPAAYVPGHVGTLELSGWLLDRGRKVQALKLATGERAVIAYQVSGVGNLYGIKAIEPPPVPGMRTTPLPGAGDEAAITVGANGPEGSRTWQTTIAFDAPGRFEVPVLEFVAFDPFEERYVASSAGPFTVEVTGEPVAAAPTAGEADAAAAPTPARRELRPIAAQARLGEASGGSLGDAAWVPLAASLPWALGLLWLLGWVVQRRRSQEAPARRVAQALEAAEAALDAAREAGDHAAVRAAVQTYLETRLQLEIRGRTFAQMRDLLRRQGVASAPAEALVTQLEHCDYARFAPSDDRAGDLARTTAALVAALREIDRTPQRGASARSMAWLLVGLAMVPAARAGAETLDAGFEEANAHYLAERYEAARRGYERLLAHRLEAPAVHYNLGNALVRLGRLGEAVAHYRVAQRMG